MRFLRPDDTPPAWIIDRLREPLVPAEERPQLPVPELDPDAAKRDSERDDVRDDVRDDARDDVRNEHRRVEIVPHSSNSRDDSELQNRLIVIDL